MLNTCLRKGSPFPLIFLLCTCWLLIVGENSCLREELQSIFMSRGVMCRNRIQQTSQCSPSQPGHASRETHLGAKLGMDRVPILWFGEEKITAKQISREISQASFQRALLANPLVCDIGLPFPTLAAQAPLSPFSLPP